MKTIKFQTSPDDEWLVCKKQIMYRCQDGLYNDDIEWENTTLAEAVKAMLDAKYPRLPQPRIIEQLQVQGTELGELIYQHQEGKLIFVPISMLEEWKEKVSVLHDKLIELGELPGLACQEESFLNGRSHISWDLYLEIFCVKANLPSRCWVEIENSRGGLEVIEVVNRKPQYRIKSSFGNGIQFSKFFEVVE